MLNSSLATEVDATEKAACDNDVAGTVHRNVVDALLDSPRIYGECARKVRLRSLCAVQLRQNASLEAPFRAEAQACATWT